MQDAAGLDAGEPSEPAATRRQMRCDIGLQVAAVRAVTTHQNRTEAIWKRLNKERNITGRPAMTNVVSAWEAYNAIQGYVQHDAQAKEGFKGDFDRILRASNSQEVKAAEKLAMELAA